MTYLAIIDCGLTESRAHVFQCEGDLSTLRAVALNGREQLWLVAKPGLRVPADSSALNVATHLAPIVKDLQYLFEARFPHVKHGSVPIYLLGSGLQDADPEEAAVIMGHGITLLDAFEYFKKGRRETNALVPSVEDHKAFVWVALQYDRHLSGAIPLSIFASDSKSVQLKYHDEIKALSVHLEFAEWQDSLSNLSTEPSDFVIGMAALIIQNDMATWNVGGRPALPPIEFTLRGSLRLESAPLASTTPSWGTPLYHHISHIRKQPGERKDSPIRDSKSAAWMAKSPVTTASEAVVVENTLETVIFGDGDISVDESVPASSTKTTPSPLIDPTSRSDTPLIEPPSASESESESESEKVYSPVGSIGPQVPRPFDVHGTGPVETAEPSSSAIVWESFPTYDVGVDMEGDAGQEMPPPIEIVEQAAYRLVEVLLN